MWKSERILGRGHSRFWQAKFYTQQTYADGASMPT